MRDCLDELWIKTEKRKSLLLVSASQSQTSRFVWIALLLGLQVQLQKTFSWTVTWTLFTMRQKERPSMILVTRESERAPMCDDSSVMTTRKPGRFSSVRVAPSESISGQQGKSSNKSQPYVAKTFWHLSTKSDPNVISSSVENLTSFWPMTTVHLTLFFIGNLWTKSFGKSICRRTAWTRRLETASV